MPRQTIGPYRLVGVLGSGGAGTVYRAVDPRTSEPLAVKVLAAGKAMDVRAAKRLAREFETLWSLSHPNVVRVFDSGVHDGCPYLVMELVEGLTLRNYLSLDEQGHSPFSTSSLTARSRSLDDSSADFLESPFGLDRFDEEDPSESFLTSTRSGPSDSGGHTMSLDSHDDGPLHPASGLTPAQLEGLNRPERVGRLKDALAQLCEALSYIHGHGIVHRDLKPSNVMVDDDRQVRLMDFGLAKYLADDGFITAGGKMVGTFRYMAPEQIMGEPLDGRTDLYSLGVILYELLSGSPPFDAPTPYELWQKVLETEPAHLLSLNQKGDGHLAQIAHKLMRKEPDARFQTAEEVLEALSE